MSLDEYRGSAAEQLRTSELLKLTPAIGRAVLDIGARDGHFSLLFAERFEDVVAFDLVKPTVAHPKVRCVQGDAADLEFADESFDFVFCAEVLEHIPPSILTKVCHEIERVSKSKILIGVPYKQDTRVGRTTCRSCGRKNPAWGHVNTFDEARLVGLFPGCEVESMTLVGVTSEQTNALSSVLMDLAGNPYGTYSQGEHCIHCDSALIQPPARDIGQKILTRLAFWSRAATSVFAQSRGNWMHILLTKKRRG